MPMCPSYAFIDRADGRVNRAMDFKKDYSGLISAAWDIDNAYDRYLNNPEEDSYDLIKQLGLDEETSKKSAEVRNQPVSQFSLVTVTMIRVVRRGLVQHGTSHS